MPSRRMEAELVRDNLLYLRSATVDGRPGRFLFGSANPQSVLDAHFAQAVGARPFHSLQLNERESLRFTPAVLDLRGVADAIIGADVWGAHAVTIDYRAGLLTFQREGIHPDLMNVYTFRDAENIRKRWVRLLYQGRTQVRLVAQAASVDGYAYWEPMFYEAMRTVRFGDWFA